jgi:hypothetical protein
MHVVSIRPDDMMCKVIEPGRYGFKAVPFDVFEILEIKMDDKVVIIQDIPGSKAAVPFGDKDMSVLVFPDERGISLGVLRMLGGFHHWKVHGEGIGNADLIKTSDGEVYYGANGILMNHFSSFTEDFQNRILRNVVFEIEPLTDTKADDSKIEYTPADKFKGALVPQNGVVGHIEGGEKCVDCAFFPDSKLRYQVYKCLTTDKTIVREQAKQEHKEPCENFKPIDQSYPEAMRKCSTCTNLQLTDCKYWMPGMPADGQGCLYWEPKAKAEEADDNE